MDALGRHVLVEFTGCDAQRLSDLNHISQAWGRSMAAPRS
ncbi:MAG: hypothetical protein H6Q00_250 [Holophagaceae bacterium]|nr:hypothetical protein [Holophagaceae bacterium]